MVAARESRDPIEMVKKMILDHGFLSEKEIKEIEKQVFEGVVGGGLLGWWGDRGHRWRHTGVTHSR